MTIGQHTSDHSVKLDELSTMVPFGLFHLFWEEVACKEHVYFKAQLFFA